MVQYRSDSSAIRIDKSTESGRLDIHLIRLVDGEVPTYPIWITEERIDWALLDNVVEARRPDLMKEVARQTGLGDSQLDEQLAFWARVLRDVAKDFIHGSFAALEEASALVRSHVVKNPQQVQLLMPSGAPSAEVADATIQIQRTVPPEVGVTARRYRQNPTKGSN